MSNSGSCQCGGIQYTVEGEPLMTYACHCSNCQKRTGSAFSMGSIFPASALTISGNLTQWDRISDDGHTNSRYSCSACGNIIYGVASSTPDVIKLQTGTLDNRAGMKPDAHLWVKSSQRWVQLPETTLQYDTQPAQLLDVYQAVVERQHD